jgi:hypothetical protein
MLVEIVLFLAVSLSLAYLILLFYGKPLSYQGPMALYDLSKPEVVLPNKNCPWTGAPTSIRFAIYVEKSPKTVAKVDCLDPPAPTQTSTSFAPSCSDYSFNKCACNATDCTRCAITSDSYLSKLLHIGQALEFWASGYTSTNDKPYVPALLKINTGSGNLNSFMESVSLPAIPLQRWTVVTIVKEGRRFDVYYGQKLVASKLCENVPIPPSSGSDWKAGVPGWVGRIGLFAGYPKAQSQDDINKDVSSLVNTRGVPFFLDEIKFDFNFDVPCAFGNCNGLPAVKPLNPFAVYSSTVQ